MIRCKDSRTNAKNFLRVCNARSKCWKKLFKLDEKLFKYTKETGKNVMPNLFDRYYQPKWRHFLFKSYFSSCRSVILSSAETYVIWRDFWWKNAKFRKPKDSRKVLFMVRLQIRTKYEQEVLKKWTNLVKISQSLPYLIPQQFRNTKLYSKLTGLFHGYYSCRFFRIHWSPKLIEQKIST